MDGSSLNVAAPVFRPSGAAPSFVSAPRQPLPMQAPSSSPEKSDRPGRPTLLTQIHNQMASAHDEPGGVSYMNPNSRPFVPGAGVKPQILEPQAPTSQFQGASPIASPSHPPQHSPTHAINPGSVQLTGLPAFLATPPIFNHIPHSPYSPAYTGPPSPLSPALSGSVSPFLLPTGQPHLGLPRSAPLMNNSNNFQQRKSKGLPPVTPLKTTGHNSTPSISMNPAVFAANLAALKAKKKVVVCLPAEQPLSDDESLLGQTTDNSSVNAMGSASSRARASALTRSKWRQRLPWTTDQYDLVPCIDMPKGAISTRDIHPEPWPYSMGLPDTIEIYLPGMSAWDEYLDMRYEEQQMEADKGDNNLQSPFDHTGLSLPPNTAAFNPGHGGRSLSISTPADPSMVAFKLNRFLQSQQQAQEDVDQLPDHEAALGLDDAAKPLGRFPHELPSRLREAFARRRGESTNLEIRPALKHSHTHTMSLGLPSSGGPFGPDVFSALDMIRANSDEGPSKPPSEAQDLPDKPLSDPEAFGVRGDIFLSNITEEDAEDEDGSELAAERHTRAGSWKDLGRGFGYEPDAQDAAPHASFRSHARHTSNFSVSTSRNDEDESDHRDLEGEEAEVRTNPSEDADASDFEEELDEYGPDHWHAHRGSVPLSAFGDSRRRYGDEDASQASNDDSLQDSLTPSDEQFSNPSDEEAAREERMLRRQHRAAERVARRERRQRRRGRASTDNTLPSSSIGEAELHKTGRYAHYEHDEVVSNPSDEILSDIDDSQTFGHDGPPPTAGPGPRFSRDFRFPPPKPTPAISPSQTRASHIPSVNHPPMSGTLGRASGLSLLNPDAKEFKFDGAGTGSRSVSAPVSGEHNSSNAASGHFRLPSIKTSSFGSALGDVPANAAHLNVGAAPFTPGAFTFKSVRRLEVPETSLAASSSNAAAGADDDFDDRQVENRELQGREKRLRYGPIDYDSQDERYPAYSTSPPRPKASAASIEGPLRSFSSLASKGPPPFLPADYLQQQRSVSHEARLTADAPSFVPTWAKGAQPFGGSTSFKRPSLPDWNQQADKNVETKASPSILDPAFFALNTGSKAVPIRHPSERSQEGDGSTTYPSTRPDDVSAVLSSDVAALGTGHTSNGALRASTAGHQPAPDRHSKRAQPVEIPPRPDRHASPSVSLASDAAAGPSGRQEGYGTFSRGSVSSMDWRFGRKYPDRNGSKAERDSDGYDCEEDEESLVDVVEEIVERLDKALEGWAGKILDEVTIMGQVRPHPRNAAGISDIAVVQDAIVQEMTSRLEQVLDSRLTSKFFATHARKLTDASDETHSTIRPVRKRPSSTDVKMTSSVTVDTPGEMDFDYVQDILEVKLNEFRTNIESSLTQVVEKLEGSGDSNHRVKHVGNGEGGNNLGLPSELAEVITARLMSQLEALLRQQTTASEEIQSSSGAELQKAMQSKLDENLFLLSEQGAAGRSTIQQMLESEMHTLEQSISKIGGSVEEHLRSALVEYLPPLLQDKASSDTTLADRLTQQLGSALGPVLSEERRCLLEENQRSRDLLLEALPSSFKIAQSTVELVEPLVKSLKSDPVDSDALVGRLAEVIGKQSIEHLVDLTPVLALLEPLIVKHEEARSFSKKILERQEDTERTLSELPYAINAKTEIFLSSAHDTSERQALILEKIAEIKAELRSRSTAPSNPEAIDTEALHKKLEDLTEDKLLTRETAERTLSELAGVYQVLDSSYEALSRLEAQQNSSEESHRELTTKLEKQAEASADLAKELREAEARAARAEAGQAEAAAKSAFSDKEATMLREQLAQITAELAASKAENAKEREASAKTVADAEARADRAEAAHVETQHRMGRLLEQANVAEREAYDSAKSVLERASKAEGQVAALEKRISEQDNKIANLQQLSATQKQKAAQSHQKLAEGEKRVKELEGKTEQLAETTARLKVFEEKAVELEQTRRELQQSVERETRAKGQVGEYEERFNQMERDLTRMKEDLVEHSTHEEVKLQLRESQKLVEELEAKLRAEHTSPQTNDGWETVSNGAAWSFPHGSQQNGVANRSIRSVSFASTEGGSNGTTTKKEVEQDEGGWWS